MRMYSASGRSRWPYVIGAAVVVLAVGGGLAYANTRGDTTPTAVHTTTPASAAPTSLATGGTSGSGDNEGDAAPTGCLGGQDRTAAMVLAAQKSAGHSTYGAVEVATAIYRFIWQNPHPSVADLNAVSAAAISSDANASFKNLAASYSGVSDMTSGQVPAGESFHLSTTNGLWMVSENSSPEQVQVNLAEGYVIDGALSPTKAAVISLTMDWESGSWHLLKGGTPDQTKLANGGARYTGGC